MADPDHTGLFAAIAAAITGGGLGGRHIWSLTRSSAEHKERLDALESISKRQDTTISKLNEQSIRAEETLGHFSASLEEVKTGVSKIVKHITGVDL